MGPSSTTVFNNNGSSGESNVVVSLISVPAVTRDNQYMNNNTATITAINNNVVKRLTDNKSDTATSVISGPRASFTAINFETKLLTADDYSRYGKTGQSIAGAAGTYRFIDTTVRVVGTTGITEQLPIRIIQKE
jgi:hypothetical protein